jgi:hypothetical protein
LADELPWNANSVARRQLSGEKAEYLLRIAFQSRATDGRDDIIF